MASIKHIFLLAFVALIFISQVSSVSINKLVKKKKTTPAPDSDFVCMNGGQPPYCCANGSTSPYCCENNSTSEFCCANNSPSRYCCANGSPRSDCRLDKPKKRN